MTWAAQNKKTTMINKIKTKVQLSEDKKTWDVLLSKDDGENYQIYKKFPTDKEALMETVSIKGHLKLWNKLIK
jgi:hypothetical protein